MKNGIAFVLMVALIAPMALAAQPKPKPNAQAGQPAKKPAANKPAPAKENPKQLREEWKMGDLKLTREAVDDASYPPDIRQSAMNAIDIFLGQQDQLIADAGQKPGGVAEARKSHASLEADFQKKMAVIYQDPKYKAELDRRLAALDKEMDDMADGANKLFADLDAAGVTPEQKAEIKPAIAKAAQQLKAAKSKSASGSTKDAKVREEAVTNLRQAKAAIKQKLTPAQREKLKQKQLEAK